MAATTAAVVAEEDTELRDLLVQTLENSGVLNRIKVRRSGYQGGRARDAGAGQSRGHGTWARARGPGVEHTGPWPSLSRCTLPRACPCTFRSQN